MLPGVSATNHPSNYRVSPSLLAEEDVWGADLFCGPAAQILLGKEQRVLLKKLGGACLEGWRVSTNEDAADYDTRITDTPVYRQVNIGYMQFRLDAEHWRSPKIEWNPVDHQNEWCVQPGDVVLNKLIPIRAAWATDRVYRHPVDANCMLVRGLDRLAGVWVAICLNQEPYEAYLTQRQGLAILPRATLAGLRQLRVPAPPGELEPLSQKIWDLNDELLSNEEPFIRLMVEVEAYVQGEVKLLADSGVGTVRSLHPGCFFQSQSIEDSLLPTHVENAALRYHLDRDLQWVPLSAISSNTLGGDRLDEGRQPKRYLQLKDVGQDLFLGHLEEEPVVQAWRIYERPLEHGEVLISKLVTSPTVLFVDRQPESPVYVTDHWHRLRFSETPGAWALILNTSAIREQLAGMGMGMVQQFTYASQIEQLRISDVPLELRKHWEKALYRYHERKRQLDQVWRTQWQYAQELFCRAHDLRVRDRRISL